MLTCRLFFFAVFFALGHIGRERVEKERPANTIRLSPGQFPPFFLFLSRVWTILQTLLAEIEHYMGWGRRSCSYSSLFPFFFSLTLSFSFFRFPFPISVIYGYGLRSFKPLHSARFRSSSKALYGPRSGAVMTRGRHGRPFIPPLIYVYRHHTRHLEHSFLWCYGSERRTYFFLRFFPFPFPFSFCPPTTLRILA
ncbi:hypothetical protein P170DRAFT_228013 [Aspergillus steynii IBT 23096]|uniref:Secreted protein n=1 Tax=Aspergillus steynii IBT 23096 TaxID=1392250 RepID=A0A2I2G248_9EURO|nr:uncharacterized protein P170DRAFT_228013 [Aspergillus steynii IBT 23096]PLB46946.1 hypothetical protein P170DRAFT_228013 [Aspergillus steynii IBT 23096]